MWAEAKPAYIKPEVDAHGLLHYRPRNRRFSLCRHSRNVEDLNPDVTAGAVSLSMTLIALGSP